MGFNDFLIIFIFGLLFGSFLNVVGVCVAELSLNQNAKTDAKI